MEKYVTYPPRGLLPLPGVSTEGDEPEDCDVWGKIFEAALLVNPAFNIYHIFDTVSGKRVVFLCDNLIHFYSRRSSGMCWASRKNSPFHFLCYRVENSLTRGSFPQTQTFPLYFNRKDVKAAIHAPLDVDWVLCSNNPVFPAGDASLPSAFTVLPNVIEKSKRSVIVQGLADFLLIAEGARIVIQK